MSADWTLAIPVASTVLTALIGFLCKLALVDKERRIARVENELEDTREVVTALQVSTASANTKTELLLAHAHKTNDKLDTLLREL